MKLILSNIKQSTRNTT